MNKGHLIAPKCACFKAIGFHVCLHIFLMYHKCQNLAIIFFLNKFSLVLKKVIGPEEGHWYLEWNITHSDPYSVDSII